MTKIYAFILLIVADSLIGQAHTFGIDFELSLIIQQALVAWFVYYLISYRHLTLKTITFIFALSETTDMACYLNDTVLDWMIWVDLIIVIPWLLYAIYRSNDEEDALTSENNIYLLSHKPDNFMDFLLSLVTGTSGYSVLANGYIYGYKKGIFTKRKFHHLQKIKIKRTHIIASDKVMEYLESMIGKSWHLWQNCVTMQIHLRGWHV